MKACVVLNGEIKDYKYIKSILLKNSYDFIICADGGARHLHYINETPDYIVGDLDSLDFNIVDFYRKKNVEFKKFPSRKNETDTELCIVLAKDLNATQIHLIGALGGRIDHTIANINLMYYIKQLNINPIIKTSKEDMYIVQNETSKISGKRGDIISVIPIKDDAIGVTLEKLEYPLKNFNMKFGTPIGISNVMEEDECIITVKKGDLLVIRNKESV